MTTKRRLLFSVLVAANFLALALILSTPTHYKVDFSSVLEMWGDVFRDVDKFGLALTAIPVEREIEIGDETVRRFPLSPQHRRQQYLNAVGATMAKTAARRRIPYRFHVVSMATPNAFAIPGGHIMVTTGMLDLIESEAELAAILGHEIAHIDLKHCIENLQYQMFVERIVGSQLSQVVGIAYQLAAFGFSEIQEREADRSAVILMAKAGYSPLEAVKLYQRIEQKLESGRKPRERTKGPEGEVLRGIADALKDYFATHPQTSARMRDIEAIFDRNMPSWKGQKFYVGRSNYADRKDWKASERAGEFIEFSEGSAEFLAVRGRTAALAGNPSDAVAYLSKAIDLGETDLINYRKRAEAYIDLKDYSEASSDIAHVVDITAGQIEDSVRKARELQDADDKAGAVEVLGRASRNYETLLETYALWLNVPKIDKEPIVQSRDKARTGRLNILTETGRLMHDLGRHAEAFSVFHEVLEVDQLNWAAVEGSALARIAMGRTEEVLNGLKTLVRNYPHVSELYGIRAKSYRAAGDPKKADLEHGRYIRFRDDKVPPLPDKEWADLEEYWDAPKFKDFKAFAVRVDDQAYWYRYWGYDWSRTAAANAVRRCSQKDKRECRLYALGKRVVWSLDDDELDAAHDEYEREVRQAFINQVNALTKRIGDGKWGDYLLRGDTYANLKNYEDAIADYSAYLQTVPGAPEALYKRGVAYYKAGHYDRALADFKVSVDYNFYQDRPRGVIYRGYSHLFLGRLNDALKDFEWWISNARDDPYRGLIGRAAVQFARGNVEGGMLDLKRTIIAKPESSYWHYQVCRTLLRFALAEAARPFCIKADEILIMDADNLDGVAFMHWQKGDPDKAQEFLDDASSVDSTYPDHNTRFAEYRALLTTSFLILKGYKPGMVRKDINETVQSAIRAYQRDHGLAQTGKIDDELLGHLTPLGFGSFRIVELPGKLTRDRIKVDCASASLGRIVLISVSSDEKYRCNTDGVSVRHASPEDIAKALDHPAMKAFSEFQDCGRCPKMVVIPGGYFKMGSPPSEHERGPVEGPVHEVRIGKQFAAGKYEVTKGEFSVFVRETSYKRGEVCQPIRAQEDSEPVTCVNWKDAKAYVKWLRDKTGKTYRLLTEAEWEYVARAGTTTPFATGPTITTNQANFDGRYTYNNTGGGSFRGFTTAAGKFLPNDFLVHDMHGNVREWVEDCWTKTYDPTHTDGSAHTSGDCTFRIARGGSWKAPPKKLRSAAREGLYAQSRFDDTGFRVAREIEP